MIWNRPSNLWLGAATAIFNVIILVTASFGIHFVPELVAAVNVAFASIIALVAGQPPTINVNDSVTLRTTNGSPDKVVSFNEHGIATIVNKK